MIEKIYKPWGKFITFYQSENIKIKILYICPGKGISLQKHSKRSEHWLIKQGIGYLTLGETSKTIFTGEYVHIPRGEIHRVKNLSSEDLIIYETQEGICEEDDIIRIQDDYNRK